MAERRNHRLQEGRKKAAASGAKRKRKRTGRRWFAWLVTTGSLAVVCAVIGYLLIVLNGERILAANQKAFEFAETTIIYDAEGREAAALATVENREYVMFADIPQLLRDAFIAVEDRRFYEHDGVDFWAIGRAVVKDIMARKMVEGGSTITQQLAKNMFLSHEKTFFRKASEASIAVALENNLTKDEILELYLNRIYFGKGAHGIMSASKLYFGKNDLNDLELWEIATLAGIPKAPNVYNPISNRERSLERMNVVLMLMEQQGIITPEQAADAKRKALEYEPPEDASIHAAAQKYPAFVDYVVTEAERVTGLTEEELRVGGYNIYTTLNTKAQEVMEQAFANDELFEESPDDRIVQGAMVIIDHRTGEIVAMSGGRNYQNKGLNRALQPRQPGSAFKPIAVYGPALETGSWYPWSNLRDEKQCYGDYCPSNYNGKYAGSISMRQSLKESRNAATVWLLHEIGINRALEFAAKLGIELTGEDRNLAIALGGLTRGVTPLDMAAAYSVFASGGKAVDPYAITRIEDRNGKVIYQYKAPEAKQVIKPETAWYMTEMLQAVLEKGGTGTRARIDRPVAGKTGTTEHGIPGFKSSANRDIWFVGYTPEWSAAVWMGYDRTDEQHVLKRGSGMAAAMFAEVMGKALKNVPAASFSKPESAETVKKPPTVGGFSVEWSAQDLGVRVAWAKQQGDGWLYRVYRQSPDDDDFVLLTVTAGTSVVDSEVEAGRTYTYYVVAYDQEHAYEGSPSTRRSVTIPESIWEPFEPPFDLPDFGEGEPGDGFGDDEFGPAPELPGGSGNGGPNDESGTGGGQVPAPDNGGDGGAGNDVGEDGGGGANHGGGHDSGGEMEGTSSRDADEADESRSDGRRGNAVRSDGPGSAETGGSEDGSADFFNAGH